MHDEVVLFWRSAHLQERVGDCVHICRVVARLGVELPAALLLASSSSARPPTYAIDLVQPVLDLARRSEAVAAALGEAGVLTEALRLMDRLIEPNSASAAAAATTTTTIVGSSSSSTSG